MITKILERNDTYEIVDQTMFCEHSRITDLYDEIVVQQCLDAAHDAVEQWLNRPIYPSTVVASYEYFKSEVFLPKPTIKSIVSVVAEDMDYVEHTLTENTDWKFDDIHESVRFLSTSNYDFSKLCRFRITYTSGYDADNDKVPASVVSAILMTAATLYENREDTLIGTQINEVPLDAQRLLRLHRRRPI